MNKLFVITIVKYSAFTCIQEKTNQEFLLRCYYLYSGINNGKQFK